MSDLTPIPPTYQPLQNRGDSALLRLLLAGILCFLFLLPGTPARAVEPHQSLPVVRAVLFYSPTCGHCHHVITNTFPPLYEQYGDQLEILAVDVSQEAGYLLFSAALEKFQMDRGGVPFLVIGEQYLVGSLDIPEQFPGLVAQYLAGGGIDWPDIPGMTEYLAGMNSTQAAQPTPITASPTTTLLPGLLPPAALTPSPASTLPAETTPSPVPTTTEALATRLPPGYEQPTVMDRLRSDPAGNTLAIVVLLGMVAATAIGIIQFARMKGAPPSMAVVVLFPLLCLVGLAVAGYLAYVETQQVEAFCGPVGDCNTVQQSAYARLFGILPIGVLGVMGYVALLFAWFISRKMEGDLANLGMLAALAMSVFGTIFSIYLTFLEPFVIGATCAWCLTSAIIMTVLMLILLNPGKLAYNRLSKVKKKTGYKKKIVSKRRGWSL